MLTQIKKGNCKLLSGLFRERMDINTAYLKELDSQCLLQNFYLEAGIIMLNLQVIENPSEAKLHWGWEAPTCQLRGHFLGHWLSAASALWASEKDTELKAKLDYIVSELGRCQKLNGGEWAGSIPEKYFNSFAEGRYVWSPQYTMHKTIMGLRDAYIYGENKQALEIINNLSDWYIRWTREVSKTNPYAVFSGESGGMLEIWASLYEITKDEKYMELVKCYENQGLFATLCEGKDELTNCHANASIPLSHGAAKLYEITGDEKWKNITELFWKCAVTDRGMYCTSGQNAGEFWVPPDLQGEFLGTDNQEFCTVYNMVRTASYLFKWTGKKEYADYIERCLYNGFLAQQNKFTGMPTYFLPLSAGSKKKWGSKTHDFWCCHGTMVQAQTLYPDLIYYVDEEKNRLVVSQYISSEMTFEHNGEMVKFQQNTDMKYYNDTAFFDENDKSTMSRWALKFNVSSNTLQKFTISFRVPAWVAGEPTVTVNGKVLEKLEINNGYIDIENSSAETEITIYFPSKIVMERLADMPELAAAVDGPIVLAGLTDRDCGLSGDFSQPLDFLKPRCQHSYGTFSWQQNCYRTRNQAENFLFMPLYDVTDEIYTVYFTEKFRT